MLRARRRAGPVIGIDASPVCEGGGGVERGGVARALEGLLRGIASLADAEGARPVALFPPGSFSPAAAAILAAAPPGRFEVVRATRPPRSPRASRREIVRLASARRPDAFLSPWSAFPRLDRLDPPVPVVATVHEVPFVRLGPVEGRLRTWIPRRALALDAAGAAAIVVPSAATRDDVVAAHPEAAAKVVVVPQGFNPVFWGAAKPDPSRAGRPYGILVGATHRRKGIETFLDAFPYLAALRLSWVLAGAPRDRGVLSRARARGDVEIVPARALDDATLYSLVAGARLLVYPSLSEGFGFPPLEAMAAGVPVVASAAGSIPEVAGDAARLVPAGNPAALARGIRAVATDDALRARLVTAGRARAARFPCAEAARRTLAVLDNVIESVRGHSS